MCMRMRIYIHGNVMHAYKLAYIYMYVHMYVCTYISRALVWWSYSTDCTWFPLLRTYVHTVCNSSSMYVIVIVTVCM